MHHVKINYRSPAFRMGFVDGFTSLFRFGSGAHFSPRRTYTHDTVGKAWRDIGQTLNNSYKQEMRQFDKKAHHVPSQQRH